MPSIGNFAFKGWQGTIKPPQIRYQLMQRRGLAGYGVGFDTEMIEPAEIVTRDIVTAGALEAYISGYRAMQGGTVTVRDGIEKQWVNVLVITVSNITRDLQLTPAGSYLLSATWLIMPDISTN